MKPSDEGQYDDGQYTPFQNENPDCNALTEFRASTKSIALTIHLSNSRVVPGKRPASTAPRTEIKFTSLKKQFEEMKKDVLTESDPKVVPGWFYYETSEYD